MSFLSKVFGRKTLCFDKNMTWGQTRTVFFQSLDARNLDVIGDIVAAHPDALEWRNHKNKSCLHIAMKKNDLGLFKSLLAMKANPDQVSSYRFYGIGFAPMDEEYTILQRATEKGRTEFVEAAIEYGGTPPETFPCGLSRNRNVIAAQDLLRRADIIRQTFLTKTQDFTSINTAAQSDIKPVAAPVFKKELKV